MKKILGILVGIVSIAYVVFTGKLPTAEKKELSKHNLEWIDTQSEFETTDLSVEEIDQKIISLIEKQTAQNTLVTNMEVPINPKKLEYLGYIFPKQTGLFDFFQTWPTDMAHLGKQAHFYKYDDFIFSTENDNATDQKNIYFAIRSLLILKHRYTELYNAVFENTKKYISTSPQFQTYANANKAFWISFNDNPVYIASNNTAFLGDGYFPNSNIGKYNNVPIINIDAENILGESESIGSAPIYKKSTPSENYDTYMKEGLLVSMAHEMIHNYVDYAHSADKTFAQMKQYRNEPSFKYVEENGVVNTLNTYFKQKGGLLAAQYEYYTKNVFEPNLTTLKNDPKINTYTSALSGKTLNQFPAEKVFVIPVF